MVPGGHPQLAIDDDDASLDAGQDRLEERVRVVELGPSLTELS
jgi:hypothetical protein